MATQAEWEAEFDKINQTTNLLAAEVAAIREALSAGGLTADQEAALFARLQAIEPQLLAIAAPPVPPVA